MTEHNFPIDSAAVTDRGLSEKRPQNEDSFLEINHKGLFAVADGVGGAQAGDVASQMAVEILAEAFLNFNPNDDAEEMMKIAIEKANSAIFQMSRELPQLSTMATTIVALHVSGNIATIGHVGDSRLYRLDGRGRLYPETQDHSIVAEEVRAGRMTVAQAANHPSKNIISRALGAEPMVDVDMKTIMFEPKTTFLLCSDGITRHIEDFEIRDLLMSREDADKICLRMKEICYERGAEDNLTAVIVRVKPQAARVAGNSTGAVTEVREGIDNTVPLFTEEETIASARPSAAGDHAAGEEADAIEIDDDEIPTKRLEMPAEIEEEISGMEMIDQSGPTADLPIPPVVSEIPPAPEEVSEEISESDEILADLTEPAEGLSVETAESAVSENGQMEISEEIEADVRELQEPVGNGLPEAAETPDRSGTGLIGSIISSIGIFLIGAVLGAGLFYVFSQRSQLVAVPPPPAPQQQAQNLAQNDFETARREVDVSPQEYIRENAAAAESGEDFYLLGRAYFFEGNFLEAKKAFEEARARLGEIDEENRKVIENDIASFLTNINVPFAARAIREFLDKKAEEEGRTLDESNAADGN